MIILKPDLGLGLGLELAIYTGGVGLGQGVIGRLSCIGVRATATVRVFRDM